MIATRRTSEERGQEFSTGFAVRDFSTGFGAKVYMRAFSMETYQIQLWSSQR